MFRGMRIFLASDEAKAKLSAEIGAEKLTELEQALDVGDYDAVRNIASEFSEEMERAGEVMQDYYGGIDTRFNDYEGYYRGIDDGSVWREISEAEWAHQQNI